MRCYLGPINRYLMKWNGTICPFVTSFFHLACVHGSSMLYPVSEFSSFLRGNNVSPSIPPFSWIYFLVILEFCCFFFLKEFKSYQYWLHFKSIFVYFYLIFIFSLLFSFQFLQMNILYVHFYSFLFNNENIKQLIYLWIHIHIYKTIYIYT